MHFRRIMFSASHVSNPEFFVAMRRDRVENWIKHGNGLAEISDNIDNDYPNIRAFLLHGRHSYNFHLLDTLGLAPVKGLICRSGMESSSDAPFSQELVDGLLQAV